MKKHGKYVVEVTTDYSRFEKTPENRRVRNNESTKALRESMRTHGFLPVYPLWVYPNGKNKLKIKSGHHRYEMAKELGLPIYYMVYPNIGTMYEFEHATNRWIIINFLESLVFSHPEYQKVLDYYNKTKIPISTVVQMLKDGDPEEGGGQTIKDFKQGNYRVGNTRMPEMVGGLVVFLKSIGVTFAKNRSFVMALISSLKVPGFSVDIFKKKAKSNLGEFKKRSSKYEYLDVIETVYNKNNSKKLSIAFYVKNKMKEEAA